MINVSLARASSVTLIALIWTAVNLASTAAAQKLTVWVWANENTAKQFAAVTSWYEAEHPGVTIELVPISGNQREFIQQLYLAIASGASPDVSWIEGGAVKQLAAEGLLVDVTRIVDGLEFTPGEAQEMMFDGKMYAAPWYATSRGFFKHVDLLQNAGIDPEDNPANLDELWDWNQRLVESTGDGSFLRVGFVPWTGNWYARGWIWTFGGELVEEVNGSIRPTAALPQNIRAYEWIDEWAQFYGRNRSPVQLGTTGFINGRLALMPGSTSDAANLLASEVKFTVGYVPHPPEGRRLTWGGGHAVGIPTAAANAAEAAKLVRYFVEPDVQIRRWRTFQSLLPATWEALMVIGPELEPEYMALIDQLPYSVPRTPLSGEYHDQLTAAMNAVIAASTTAQAALESVQIAMAARFAEIFGR